MNLKNINPIYIFGIITISILTSCVGHEIDGD